MTDNNRLDACYNDCRTIIKKNSRSFYIAFSKLPNPKNKAVYALYAFCRQADDAIDNAQNKEEQIKNLTDYKRDLTLFLEGNRLDEPVWICLSDVFNHYEMDGEAFWLQLKGQELDIEFKQPETLEDLIDYSYYVASSVGLMMLPIVATKKHQQLTKVAIDLGIAMQITNILRDVGEDYHQLHRIYLPKDLMRDYQVTEEMIQQKEMTPSFIDLWENLAQLATNYYEIFYQNISLFDEDCQYQLLVAARLYEQILSVIRKNDYSCLTKKNKVTKKDMLRIALNGKKEIRLLKDR